MTDDLYNRCYAAAQAEMKQAGIRTSNGVAPYVRIGLTQRPPCFVPFRRVVLPFSAYFALTGGMAIYFVIYEHQGFPLWFDCCLALIAVLLWGFSIALLYRYVRFKRDLANWEDLG